MKKIFTFLLCMANAVVICAQFQDESLNVPFSGKISKEVKEKVKLYKRAGYTTLETDPMKLEQRMETTNRLNNQTDQRNYYLFSTFDIEFKNLPLSSIPNIENYVISQAIKKTKLLDEPRKMCIDKIKPRSYYKQILHRPGYKGGSTTTEVKFVFYREDREMLKKYIEEARLVSWALETKNMEALKYQLEQDPHEDWIAYINKQIPRIAYELAVAKKEILPLMEFIQSYPESNYIADAYLEIKKVEERLAADEKVYFDQCLLSGKYDDFLSKYPSSVFAERMKLEKVMAEKQLAIQAAEEAKRLAEAAKIERDDINRYVKIKAQDIFFAKGDGLNFLEWVASSNADYQNWNVFVMGRLKNEGRLPKRIKATSTLNITDEMEVGVLFISEKKKNVSKYTNTWYLDLAPGEESVMVGFFKFRESASSEGNILFRHSSRKYVDENNGYSISLDYYDDEISPAHTEYKNNLINSLRKSGNVAVKTGYASQYREARAQRNADYNKIWTSDKETKEERELKEKVKTCLECEIDWKKTTRPTESSLILFTIENPGYIVMKNGESYKYYWDTHNNRPVVRGFIFDYSYKSFNDMIDKFLKKCKEKYCEDLNVHTEE